MVYGAAAKKVLCCPTAGETRNPATRHLIGQSSWIAAAHGARSARKLRPIKLDRLPTQLRQGGSGLRLLAAGCAARVSPARSAFGAMPQLLLSQPAALKVASSRWRAFCLARLLGARAVLSSTKTVYKDQLRLGFHTLRTQRCQRSRAIKDLPKLTGHNPDQ